MLWVILFLIQFIVVICICGHTSKIHSMIDSLHLVNKKVDSLVNQLVDQDPSSNDNGESKESASDISADELMEKYNIAYENEKYRFKAYTYDRFQDAVNYAKSNQSV